MYGSETMIWKEKRYRIRGVQMDILRGLQRIKRIDKIENALIRELCGVMKGLMKVLPDGSDMWRELRMTGLLRGYM